MNVKQNDSPPRSFRAQETLSGNFQQTISQWRFPFSERRILLVLFDGILALTAVSIAFLLWQQTAGIFFSRTHVAERWYWFPVLAAAWIVLSWLNDLYDIPSTYNKSLTAVRVGTVATLLFVVYLLVFFIQPTPLPRLLVVYFLLVAAPLVVGWRWTYAIVFSAPRFRQRVLIVGANDRGATIAQALDLDSVVNYEVVGYLDQSASRKNGRFHNHPILGKETDLPELVERYKVQEIIVAIERNLEKELFALLVDCQAKGISISWMPNLYEKLKRSVPIQHIDPAWALHAIQDKKAFNTIQAAAKRVIDLFLVLLVAPVIFTLIPLIAIAVRLDSPGPAFYIQTRSGLAGKPFRIIKFRTMTTDAEKDGKAKWASSGDPRITRLGRFLRKARLDELPQLYNVLKGEMSIVGPRPERPQFVTMLENEIPFYRTRLTVKPGITGWAQVNYDYGNTVEDAQIKLQYDFYYIRYQSLMLDIYIMFRTISVLLKLKGT